MYQSKLSMLYNKGGRGSLVFTEKTGLDNVYGVMSYCLDVSK